jgi:hypothetical protein
MLHQFDASNVRAAMADGVDFVLSCHPVGIGRRGIAACYRAPRSNRSFACSHLPMIKLQPQEAMLIKRVYDVIVEESWFHRNAVTERELLKLILRNYHGNGRDEAHLLVSCSKEARYRFSRMS